MRTVKGVCGLCLCSVTVGWSDNEGKAKDNMIEWDIL